MALGDHRNPCKWENDYYRVDAANDHFKLTNKLGGAVMVTKHNNKFLLLKIKRNDGLYHLEFPRGFSKKNEGPKDTAIRETEEELDVTPEKVYYLGRVMPDSGLLSNKMNIYICKIPCLSDIRLQEDEGIIDCIPYSRSILAKMIKQGIIVDSFTIAGFTLSNMQFVLGKTKKIK